MAIYRVSTTDSANDLKNQFDDLKHAMEDYSTFAVELEEAQRKELQQQKLNALVEYKEAEIKAAKEAIAVKAKQEAAEEKVKLKTIKDIAALQAKIDALQDTKKDKLLKKQYEKEQKRLKKSEEDRIAYIKKRIEQETKLEDKKEKIAKRNQEGGAIKDALTAPGLSLSERGKALKDAFHNEDGGLDLSKGFSALSAGLADMVTALKSQINEIASNKSAIDTRLQGSKNAKNYGGSYWEQMSKDIVSVAGASPFIKQETVVTNLKSMVDKGISYNVEQRAFLETLKDKISTTFDATNATLTRLVRVQQQDSTAARLGMESALNTFLNNMYETTEYMSDVMTSIKSSLEEAEALMSTQSAAAFEYQVQKWMGSMYSVGMSSSGVQSIATALGQLASGNISGITGNGTGNLLVMAANNAGISVADALAEGLDESSTNKLMSAMVQYLSQIYEETKDSKVVQQQYANVFGLTASDLKALSNLNATDIKTIGNNNLSYGGMLGQLTTMANSMASRTSTSELLTNLTSNLKYSLASSIASDPALYTMFTLADTLDSLTGGIDFSMPLVMGTGTAQTFNVADIMKVATLSGGLISSMSSIFGGLASGSGGIMDRVLGLGSTSVSRGNGGGLVSTGGVTTSSSGFIGNSSSGDVMGKTMSDTTDSANSQTIEATEESNEIALKDVNENVIAIYNILLDVTTGTSTFKVDMGDSSAWTMAMKGL